MHAGSVYGGGVCTPGRSKKVYLSVPTIAREVIGPSWPLNVCNTTPDIISVTRTTPFLAPDARYRSLNRAMHNTGLLWVFSVKIIPP